MHTPNDFIELNHFIDGIKKIIKTYKANSSPKTIKMMLFSFYMQQRFFLKKHHIISLKKQFITQSVQLNKFQTLLIKEYIYFLMFFKQFDAQKSLYLQTLLGTHCFDPNLVVLIAQGYAYRFRQEILTTDQPKMLIDKLLSIFENLQNQTISTHGHHAANYLLMSQVYLLQQIGLPKQALYLAQTYFYAPKQESLEQSFHTTPIEPQFQFLATAITYALLRESQNLSDVLKIEATVQKFYPAISQQPMFGILSARKRLVHKEFNLTTKSFYDQRWQLADTPKPNDFWEPFVHKPQKLDIFHLINNPEQVADKTLLIYHEQGLGDLLFISRFFNYLAFFPFKKIIVHTPVSLLAFFQLHLNNNFEYVYELEHQRKFDFYLPSMDSVFLLNKFKIPPNPVYNLHKSLPPSLTTNHIKGFIQQLWRQKNQAAIAKKICFINLDTFAHHPDRYFKTPQKHLVEKLMRQNPDILFLNPHPIANIPNQIDISTFCKDFLFVSALLNASDFSIQMDSAYAHLACQIQNHVSILLNQADPYFTWTPHFKASEQIIIHQSTHFDWDQSFENLQTIINNLS